MTTATAITDLSTPAQVHDLVTVFYREVALDEELEPFFGEVAEVDWAIHIPRLIDYWCAILFDKPAHQGPITRVHRDLHGQRQIQPIHCDRWYQLWAHSVDSGWSGPYADKAKRHGEALMTGMAKHIFGFSWSPNGEAVANP